MPVITCVEDLRLLAKNAFRKRFTTTPTVALIPKVPIRRIVVIWQQSNCVSVLRSMLNTALPVPPWWSGSNDASRHCSYWFNWHAMGKW